MPQKEFKIQIQVSGQRKGLNIVSDTNNIDYVLEKIRKFLTELER
jgi:hypothetical protein